MDNYSLLGQISFHSFILLQFSLVLFTTFCSIFNNQWMTNKTEHFKNFNMSASFYFITDETKCGVVIRSFAYLALYTEEKVLAKETSSSNVDTNVASTNTNHF